MFLIFYKSNFILKILIEDVIHGFFETIYKQKEKLIFKNINYLQFYLIKNNNYNLNIFFITIII